MATNGERVLRSHAAQYKFLQAQIDTLAAQQETNARQLTEPAAKLLRGTHNWPSSTCAAYVDEDSFDKPEGVHFGVRDTYENRPTGGGFFTWEELADPDAVLTARAEVETEKARARARRNLERAQNRARELGVA